MPGEVYNAAVAMLARRELSETQLRQRLTRKGYDRADIDAALARLKSERSLDDERVAGAIARTEAHLRKHGKVRVRQRIQAAGIASAIADRIADEVFADIDPEILLAAALEKRLRGQPLPTDDRGRQRLYRYLIGQGFEHDRVLAALRARRSST